MKLTLNRDDLLPEYLLTKIPSEFYDWNNPYHDFARKWFLHIIMVFTYHL